MAQAAASQPLDSTMPGAAALGSTMPGTIPNFNAGAATIKNPGRAGTKIGIHDHHPPSSLTAANWHEISLINMTNAKAMTGHATDLTALSKKTHQGTTNSNIQQYQAVEIALKNKVEKSRELIEVLDERTRAVTRELQRTKESCAHLQSAYNAKMEPISLCTYRQTLRAQRARMEMVRDAVELALEEEKETLLDSQEQLQNAINSTELLIQTLNDTVQDLGHDQEAKLHAIDVDEACIRNRHTTWPATKKDATLPKTPRSEVSAPYVQWYSAAEEKRQQDSLQRTNRAKDKEVFASAVRDENEALIAKTAQACHEARSNVEKKMLERIAEMQAKRRDIELSLQDTSEKLEQMAQVRALTDLQIQSQSEPENILKQTMDLRASRQSTENIADPVTTELMENQQILKQSKGVLERRKEEEKMSIAMLRKTQADLQADLEAKTIALQLDMQCQKTGARDTKVMANLMV